jgi:hypothetical protein
MKCLLLACASVLFLASSLRAGDPKPPVSLFDGKTLGSWKSLAFGGEGAVFVEDGEMRLGQGSPLTGVVWQGKLPARTNYEISLEAKKIKGTDFMLALTFPVNDSHCSFVVGGWGGGVVGISSINNMDASENETTTFGSFEEGKWYKIQVRVRPDSITCAINDKTCVDLDIKVVKIGMRFGEIEMCVPLGMATYETSAAYRNLTWRPLEADGN